MGSETSTYIAQRKLWRDMPPTLRSESEWAVVDDESLATIIRLAGLYSGDWAGAAARRQMLLSAGALKARRCEDGTILYTKSETFPEPDDPQDWVDRANERIQRGAAEEQARLRREREAAEAAQRTLDAPLVDSNRRHFAAMLDEHGLSPEKLAATIEAAVERVLRANGPLDTVSAGSGPHDAGDGSQEGDG